MRSPMNPTLKMLLLGLGVAVTTTLLLLSGRHLNAGVHPHAATPAPAEVSEPVHQAPLGKPGAAVQLAGPAVTSLDVHEQRDLELLLDAEPGQVLTIDLRLDEGLQLASAQTRWQFAEAPSRVRLPLSVYAAIEGSHFIHVFVTAENSHGQRTSRALAVQVRVGAEHTLELQNKTIADKPQHPAYISLPAAETIR